MNLLIRNGTTTTIVSDKDNETYSIIPEVRATLVSRAIKKKTAKWLLSGDGFGDPEVFWRERGVLRWELSTT